MVHDVGMRTSINLDPDVYSFASAYADAKGITLSAAISELVRRAEQVPEPTSDSPRLKTSPHGYLVIAGTGDALTLEMVKEASEDELV
jgi:macrodomain Ter protein organizer (MatP/YcbG family)